MQRRGHEHRVGIARRGVAGEQLANAGVDALVSGEVAHRGGVDAHRLTHRVDGGTVVLEQCRREGVADSRPSGGGSAENLCGEVSQRLHGAAVDEELPSHLVGRSLRGRRRSRRRTPDAHDHARRHPEQPIAAAVEILPRVGVDVACLGIVTGGQPPVSAAAMCAERDARVRIGTVVSVEVPGAVAVETMGSAGSDEAPGPEPAAVVMLGKRRRRRHRAGEHRQGQTDPRAHPHRAPPSSRGR